MAVKMMFLLGKGILKGYAYGCSWLVDLRLFSLHPDPEEEGPVVRCRNVHRYAVALRRTAATIHFEGKALMNR